jgi:hypothetical protein
MLNTICVIDNLIAFFQQGLFHPFPFRGAIYGFNQFALVSGLEFFGFLQYRGRIEAGNDNYAVRIGKYYIAGNTLMFPQESGHLFRRGLPCMAAGLVPVA